MSNELTTYSSAGLEKLLQSKRNDFIKLLNGRPEVFTRELSFAAQALNANDQLLKCDKGSIGAAIFNVALTGLSLNPITKLAYLTPRWNSRKQAVECLLMPSYQGMVKTITDTGCARKVEAHLIMNGDVFTQEYTNEGTRITHKPAFPKGKTIIGAWAIATLSDGSTQVEVMDKDELDYIRSMSDSWKAFEAGKAKSSIWKDWEGEMCRKTVIKRLVKYLPKTEQFEKVANLVELDNADYSAKDWQIAKIEALVATSTYDAQQRSYIEAQLEGDLTSGEANKIIADLEVNQLDPINAGLNYSQTDIKKKVKVEIHDELPFETA